MSNCYKQQLVTALRSAFTHIQYMVTPANTSFSNSVVQCKQCEYSTNAFFLLETCTLGVAKVYVFLHSINIIEARVVCGC